MVRKTLKQMTEEEKCEVYEQAARKAIKKLQKEGIGNCENKSFLSAVYFLVKRIIYFPDYHGTEKAIAQEILEEVSSTITMLGQLDLQSLENMFPIEKRYDGKKYEVKDYFSTREFIRKFPINRPISTFAKISDVLWNYMNEDITKFLWRCITAVDDMDRCTGKKPTLFEFCEENEIPVYVTSQNDAGEEFIVYIETGEIQKLFEEKMRYLGLIK